MGRKLKKSKSQDRLGLSGEADTESPEPFTSQGGTETVKKRKRTSRYIFTEGQEEDIGKWYKKNDCLYNRCLNSYKNVEKKQRLYEEKAAQFSPECTANQLKRFIEGMRTQYGRLTHPETGKWGKELNLSQRDKWILNTFHFLDEHIVRSKSRTNAARAAQPAASPDEDDDSTYEDVITPPPASPVPFMACPSTYGVERCTAPTPATPSPWGEGKNLAPRAGSQGVLDRLLERVDQVHELQQAVLDAKSEHKEQVDAFIKYLQTQLRKIPDDRWFNFTVSVMNLVQSFVVCGGSPCQAGLPVKQD